MNKLLPKPNKFGTYELDDGSKIYASGGVHPDSRHIPVHPGKYYVWIKDGETFKKGIAIPFGHVVMAKNTILYFDSAQAALEELQSGRLKKEQPAGSENPREDNREIKDK